ncbi:MAG: hypothetical protein H6732_19300 [Alphaproteobacteria bacterium]|nr:hypothetical protein [Alphaproteobacteria bacterium]
MHDRTRSVVPLGAQGARGPRPQPGGQGARGAWVDEHELDADHPPHPEWDTEASTTADLGQVRMRLEQTAEHRTFTDPGTLVNDATTPPLDGNARLEPQPGGPRDLGVYLLAFVGGLVLGAASLPDLAGHRLVVDGRTGEELAVPVGADGQTRPVEALVDEGFERLDAEPVRAVERFRAALALEPNHPFALLGLGLAHTHLGHVGAASDALCRAAAFPGMAGASARSALDLAKLSCP